MNSEAHPSLFYKNRKLLLFAFLCGLLTLIAGVGLLSLSGYLICSAAWAGLGSSAFTFNYMLPAAGIRFFAFLRILARYGERLISHDVTLKFLAHLRLWFYQRIIPLTPAYFLNHKSGDFLNRIINDIDILNNLYIRIIAPIFLQLFLILGVAGLIFFFSPFLAFTSLLLSLSIFFITPLCTYLFSKKASPLIQQYTTLLRQNFIDLKQRLQEIIIFQGQQRAQEEIQNNQTELIKHQKKINYLSTFNIFLVETFGAITLTLILYFGISLVTQHKIDGAQLAFMLLALFALYESMVLLPQSYLSLSQSQAAAERIHAITQLKPAVIFENKDFIPLQAYGIHFKDIHFKYLSTSWVWQNFNLHIPSGSKIGLFGPSGIGKSTLLQLLMRIWDPTSGYISIDNHRLTTFSEYQLRQLITLVPQHPHLFSTTLRENFLIANPKATEEDMLAALHVVHLAKELKSGHKILDLVMGEFGKKLSGGQIRRVALAQALLRNSPIILLDEPTEDLDKENSRQILKKLMEKWTKNTIVIISHQWETLQYCEQIIKLNKNSPPE